MWNIAIIQLKYIVEGVSKIHSLTFSLFVNYTDFVIPTETILNANYLTFKRLDASSEHY